MSNEIEIVGLYYNQKMEKELSINYPFLHESDCSRLYNLLDVYVDLNHGLMKVYEEFSNDPTSVPFLDLFTTVVEDPDTMAPVFSITYDESNNSFGLFINTSLIRDIGILNNNKINNIITLTDISKYQIMNILHDGE